MSTGIIIKRLETLDGKLSEKIRLELTVSEKMLHNIFKKIPPFRKSKAFFYKKLSTCLIQITNV